MRRLLVRLCLLAATPWSAPATAQARNQLGPLCTTDTTPADKMINACSKIIELKVFRGEQLATIHFWRAVGWNKDGRLFEGHHRRHRSDPAAARARRPTTSGDRLTRVRAEVVSSTKSKQVPWSNSSLLGEVYLAEK